MSNHLDQFNLSVTRQLLKYNRQGIKQTELISNYLIIAVLSWPIILVIYENDRLDLIIVNKNFSYN